jgi:integration host factor subunit beta
MTKSELIERIARQQEQLPPRDVELAVKMILEKMTQALVHNQRIEVRGFGSFCLHYRAPRMGRNPKTGDSVELTGKYVPYFKPGKDLKDRVNDSLK